MFWVNRIEGGGLTPKPLSLDEGGEGRDREAAGGKNSRLTRCTKKK